MLEIANDKNLKGDLTYRSILAALGQRAFGLALLFFSLPSALPFSFIPGISVIFSVPIAIFAIQMIFVGKYLWLPKIIADHTISHEKVAKFIRAGVPYLQKIERLLKPRWNLMTSRVAEIVTGIFILFLALLLMLPIPLSNFILAFLLIIFSLGITEEDGLLITIGYLGTITYMSFIYLFIFATIKTIF